MPTPQFSFLQILEVLARHAVEHVVVVGVCAVAHGAPVTTFDLDVLYGRAADNSDRVLDALEELDAYHREPGDQCLAPQRRILDAGGPALFMTKFGPLDFLGDLGGRELTALREHTVELTLESGLRLRILDLETLIDVKEQAGHPKELAVLPILRQTLIESRRQD